MTWSAQRKLSDIKMTTNCNIWNEITLLLRGYEHDLTGRLMIRVLLVTAGSKHSQNETGRSRDCHRLPRLMVDCFVSLLGRRPGAVHDAAFQFVELATRLPEIVRRPRPYCSDLFASLIGRSLEQFFRMLNNCHKDTKKTTKTNTKPIEHGMPPLLLNDPCPNISSY